MAKNIFDEDDLDGMSVVEVVDEAEVEENEDDNNNPIESSSTLQSPLETYLREINEAKLLTANDEK